jgi:hypothetical protein
MRPKSNGKLAKYLSRLNSRQVQLFAFREWHADTNGTLAVPLFDRRGTPACAIEASDGNSIADRALP